MPVWLVLDSYFIAGGVITGGHKPIAGRISVEEVHQLLGGIPWMCIILGFFQSHPLCFLISHYVKHSITFPLPLWTDRL